MTTPRTLLAALVVSALCLSPLAAAQDTLPAPTTTLVKYAADSGPVANPGDDWAVAYTHQVRLPGANSIRLRFAAADLAGGSYLLVTSLLDGEQHRLDAETLHLWNASTAYFNGDTVVLELHAAPGSAGNHVKMTTIEAGFTDLLPPENPLRGDPGQCGICNTDDRNPSALNFSARLMPVGCTASIVCEDNTAVTAGHCMGGSDVMQFNVPASLGNCFLVNPPVADQFPVIGGSRQGVNGGVGADWGVFRVGGNGSAAGPFQRYGEFRRIAGAQPPVGTIINIFGYGVDLTCTRNQVQQRSVGSISSMGAASMSFSADVRGGNSGSAILAGNEVIGVVTHCVTGCGNIGTRIDLAAFRTAINQTTTCDHRVRIAASPVGNNQPLAVDVTMSPSDNNGASGGATPFEGIFASSAAVTLTAPPTAGELCFSHWQLNGVDQAPGAALSFPLSGVVTATARYSAATCCPADWNDDTLINSGDISAFLTSWLSSIQLGDLLADFNADNAVNSGDISSFLTAWLDAVQNGC